MVNQELLGYIRQQLSQSVAKDTIKANLMSQGWSNQDITEGFAAIEGVTAVPASLWTNGIRRTNKVFMIISLIFVFGVDLLILISSPSLAPYWFMMLGVLVLFVIFYYLENLVFRKRFSNTSSHLDKWILSVVVLRNIVFLLNFIPLIQLLGLGLLGGFASFISVLLSGRGFMFGGIGALAFIVPILTVTYIILIIRRYSTTKSV